MGTTFGGHEQVELKFDWLPKSAGWREPHSRHCFVWLRPRQTTEDVIAGFEAASMFFSRVFPVIIPDNMSTIVDAADPAFVARR